MSEQFRNYDTKPGAGIDPNAVRIIWTRETVDDDDQPRPDEHDESFWPDCADLSLCHGGVDMNDTFEASMDGEPDLIEIDGEDPEGKED